MAKLDHLLDSLIVLFKRDGQMSPQICIHIADLEFHFSNINGCFDVYSSVSKAINFCVILVFSLVVNTFAYHFQWPLCVQTIA